MASVRERISKDGVRFYEIRVSRGRSKTQLSRTWTPPEGWSARTIKKELERVTVEFEKAVQSGEVISRDEQRALDERAAAEAAKLRTVRQYVEGIYMPTKLITLTENSRLSYKQFLDKYILPIIGDMLMEDVTPAILAGVILKYRSQGHAHASTVKLYNILNGFFDMAFMDDTIHINPMLKVKRPIQAKADKVEDESEKSLTVERLRDLLEFMETEPLKWRAFIALAVDTGMRRGEMCGLQWNDIDTVNRIITVQRNLQYSPSKGIYETTPKNGRGRKVDIGNDTLNLLHQLRIEQAKTRMSRFVFAQPENGEPMHPDSPTRYFKRLGERCGIPHFHPHMLRHTSASIAITHGADVVSVSQRLGHRDTVITLRMYAHANDESVRHAGDILRNAVQRL